MKKESIKLHLSPYSIFQKRQTTINHAFASAIAPNDEYHEKTINDAIKFLGQDPEKDLFCVYCEDSAETWDHVFGLVKDLKFSGYGHVIGNLLPCCKKCNSEKGNQFWLNFLNKKAGNAKLKQERIEKIQNYLEKYLSPKMDYGNIQKVCTQEIKEYEGIKEQILNLMKDADRVVASVRNRIKDYEKNKKS